MPTIALVDDDRNVLTSVSIALEAKGYWINTYTDGKYQIWQNHRLRRSQTALPSQ